MPSIKWEGVHRHLSGLKLYVYTNDHPPPHVHVIGSGKQVKFFLHCDEGTVRLGPNKGFRLAELNEIAEALTDMIASLCKKWSEIHG